MPMKLAHFLDPLDYTFKFKGKKCAGSEHSKERLIVLVTANMSGNEKSKLFVTGKSKALRCFKHVKHLPVMMRIRRRE